MILRPFRKRIASSTTTAVINQPCSVTQVFIAVANAGTTWKLSIQDRSDPDPLVFVPEVTLSTPSLGSWIYQHFEEPLVMDGGVDAITSGTAGALAIWINAWVNQ